MTDNTTKKASSAQRLRQCIPLMRDHGPDFGPESYAIWYYHLLGTLDWLSEAVQSALRDNGRLGRGLVDQLFRRLVAEGAEAPVIDEGAIVEAVERMSASAVAAQAATSRVMTDLDGVDAAQDPAQLQERVRNFRSALGTFAAEIERASSELELLRANLDEMRQQARLDALTGLANRRAFDQFLMEQAIAAVAAGAPLTLILLDLDHFKRINDSHGHPFGDQVIRCVAEVLRTHCREGELAARVGGEEFGLVLPGCGERDAWIRAEKIRSVIAMATVQNGTGRVLGKVTVSGGVAVHRPGEGAAQMFERADQALYLAKDRGRDRVEIATC